MEEDAARHLYKEIFEQSNKMIHLKAIDVDDNSLMRQHNNPKGRLTEEMIEPGGLADTFYCTKGVAKLIYHLAVNSNKISSCTKLDAMRFKKYFEYIIKTNRIKNTSEIGRASKAVVELDCHTFCDEK